MPTPSRVTWILATAVAGLVAAAAPAANTELREAKIGEPLPPFSVQVPERPDVTNETYRGRVLMVVFARPDHAKSLEALKVAQNVLAEYADSKLAVLAVSTKAEGADLMAAVASKHRLTFPIAVDAGRRMYGAIGVVVAPTTLLVDEAGVLRFVLPHVRVGHEDRLRTHTALLVGRIDQAEHDRRLAIPNQARVEGQDGWTRRLGLARRLVEQGKYDLAVGTLKELRAQRDVPAAIVLLGDALLRQGQVDEAAACLDALGKEEAKSPKVKAVLARLELARGNEEAAEAYLVDAVGTAPAKGPLLYQLGRIYERRGDLKKAAECYRQALQEVYGGD
jgi:tetratricopeptide (TPR) repeat protein